MKKRHFLIPVLALSVSVVPLVGQNLWTNTTPMGISVLLPTPTGSIYIGYISTDYSGGSPGILHSTDNGFTWFKAASGISDFNITAFGRSANGHLFASTHTAGVYTSTNSGTSWSQVSSPVIRSQRLNGIINVQDTLYAWDGHWCTGAYRSTDAGITWTTINNGLVPCTNGIEQNAFGYLFAATGTGGMFRSSDHGNSWSSINNGLSTLSCSWVFVNSSGHIFTTTPAGVYRSTNNGDLWTQATQIVMYYLAITNVGTIYGAARSGGLFKSTDNGGTWASMNSGLTDTVSEYSRLGLTPSGYLFVVSGPSLYRTSSPVTSATHQIGGLPSLVSLRQNFPNPFNPSTLIEFEIPARDNVALVIYNSAGQIIRRLHQGFLDAGKHRVAWDGKNDQGDDVSSGAYFYQLVSEAFSDSRKMILLK